jgi:hypothetical protein
MVLSQIVEYNLATNYESKCIKEMLFIYYFHTFRKKLKMQAIQQRVKRVEEVHGWALINVERCQKHAVGAALHDHHGEPPRAVGGRKRVQVYHFLLK